MQDNQNKKIFSAFRLVLRPIVKILLRYGIGYNEFAETVKMTFVDVGSSDFGIRGRPTNISRVAVMTGLTRKEVRRLRTKIDVGDDSVSVRTTPISEILTRWHSEDEFLDQAGRPRKLPFSGNEHSFSDLVKRFGGDVPAGAMRTELKRMNVVEERNDGFLEVKSRYGPPRDDTDRLITGLVHLAYPLMSTLCVNSDPDRSEADNCAQFATYSLSIGEENRKRLKRVCYDRLSESAIAFDDLFTAHELVSDTSASKENNSVVSIGLYYFEERDKNADYTW